MAGNVSGTKSVVISGGLQWDRFPNNSRHMWRTVVPSIVKPVCLHALTWVSTGLLRNDSKWQTGLSCHQSAPFISCVTLFKVLCISIETKGQWCLFPTRAHSHSGWHTEHTRRTVAPLPPSFLWQLSHKCPCLFNKYVCALLYARYWAMRTWSQ